jgi:drug/metabolite transporter superfamily protein YnfA
MKRDGHVHARPFIALSQQTKKGMSIVKSLSLFILAGGCEIGGGYLIWLWFKEDRSIWYGLSGAVCCILGVLIMFYAPRTLN